MAKKKKSRKKLFVFGFLGLLIIFLVAFVIIQGQKEPLISVQVDTVKMRSVTQTVTAVGQIEPEFKVVIAPEVTGEIIALPIEDGDFVKKNQLLVKINQEVYISQRERALANLKQAEASLQMRSAELTRVELEYNRTKELHAKNLVSDSELESAESMYLSYKAQFESAEANVLQQKALLREANEELRKTKITSPMDGTITVLNVEVGERVLGSGFSQGTHLLTVSDLTKMEAIVEVDENDIVQISVGDTARIKVDAFGDRVFRGVVNQIGNSAITTGMGTQEQVVNFEVRITIIDLDAGLRPGMSCNATIETETKENVVTVPIQSVTARVKEMESDTTDTTGTEVEESLNGKDKFEEIVFLFDNGKAKRVAVETGISDDNFIEVLKGLEGGETVITGSYRAISRELEDGSLVMKESGGGKPQEGGEEE